MSDAVGYVLAGGQSTRMGKDKALLPWGEGTLLGHTLARLRRVTARAPAILCGPEARYEQHGVPVFADSVTGAGALGGILTGLEKLPEDAERGLFLAVDLPLVPEALLEHLLARSEEGIDAVACYSSSGPEPLCAVYSRSCLEAVRECIEAERFKMTDFWTGICVHIVYPGALAEHGDPARMFRNANTPADYEALVTSR